jgi:catechol 2,3-dioxygenase
VRWVLSDPQRATFWGSYAPPSWFSESSLVGDLDGNPMAIHAPLLGERPAAVKVGD